MGLITIVLLLVAILGVEHTINQEKSVYTKIRKRFNDKSQNIKEFSSKGDTNG